MEQIVVNWRLALKESKRVLNELLWLKLKVNFTIHHFGTARVHVDLLKEYQEEIDLVIEEWCEVIKVMDPDKLRGHIIKGKELTAELKAMAGVYGIISY